MQEPQTLRSHTPKGARAREALIDAAEELFANAGFHGASMRDLASAAGLPLATTVYHFARKEQLYAAVLERIAMELVATLDGADLDGFVCGLVAWAVREPQRVRLLLREVLDNPTRVERATKLPLAPYLQRAAAIVAEAIHTDRPELVVLQLVGGLSYVVAARPTVDRIVGKARAREFAKSFERDALAIAYRTIGVARAR